jgi:hypothetical protein
MTVDRILSGIGSSDTSGKLPFGSLVHGVFSMVEAPNYEKPVFQSQDSRRLTSLADKVLSREQSAQSRGQ